MEIAGSVILITGASGGIGRAAARLCAAQGARVALAARSAARLETLAAEMPDALAIPTDIRGEGAVRAMVVAEERHYGRLDVLVNNAGQGMHTAVETAEYAAELILEAVRSEAAEVHAENVERMMARG